MARRDQPRYINSGYYLLPQNSLAAVPSDYAFDRDHVARQPKNQKSEYHLASLNMFDHGTRENYHYVTAEELRGLPASGENVVHGNVISLRALRERIDRMDSGFYRPILANGVLYLVPSEDNPRTARSSDSQDSVKTAIQMQTESTAREPESTRTARFPQSPLARPASQPEIRLTLHQLKKLLGKELFKDVIRKYKLQHNNRSGRNRTSSTKTAIEPNSARSAYAASSSTAVEPGASTRTARLETSKTRSTHSAAAYPPLSPLVGSESNGSLHSAVGFGAFDRSAHTACEPSNLSSTHTAHADSYSNRPAATAHSFHEGFAFDNVSSKDVETAVEPDYITRTAQMHSPIHSEYNVFEHATSSKDVGTAVEFSDSFKAAALACDSNVSAGSGAEAGLHAELDDMVATAQQYLVPDTRRSMTEQGVAAALVGAPVFDERAVRSANYIADANEHLCAATVDASIRTAREAGSFTNLGDQASRSTSTTSSTMAI
uniref:Uncharacterized protein n=1 Tax=Panagrellus redivivus TaxID=6233 RepID=A0A7E4UWM5_PANRE